MRYHSYLNTAKKIIESFAGEIPLAAFLKKYFSASKKYGSKDRKQIAALCYNFYRLGNAITNADLDQRIITATFLCAQTKNEFLEFHKSEWNALIETPLEEKCEIAGINYSGVFSIADELTEGIEFEPFCKSFFIQPDLFLRIRPGQKKSVVQKLEAAGIEFQMLEENSIILPNSSKLETVLAIDKEVVVQDVNSQQVLNYLKNSEKGKSFPNVWDCCAASGGKSILAYDILEGKFELTVSDIRESILSNLEKRFKTAGINNYQSFVADLADENCKQSPVNYQLVICDAPCTGSGTWSRTPEQLFYFKRKSIDDYANLQRKIVSNTIPQLQKGGLFIYITCSVFKKENEEVVNFIKEKFHLQLLQMELLKGYDKKADSMFVAVFKN